MKIIKEEVPVVTVQKHFEKVQLEKTIVPPDISHIGKPDILPGAGDVDFALACAPA